VDVDIHRSVMSQHGWGECGAGRRAHSDLWAAESHARARPTDLGATDPHALLIWAERLCAPQIWATPPACPTDVGVYRCSPTELGGGRRLAAKPHRCGTSRTSEGLPHRSGTFLHAAPPCTDVDLSLLRIGDWGPRAVAVGVAVSPTLEKRLLALY
jgi:hypothetical protein